MKSTKEKQDTITLMIGNMVEMKKVFKNVSAKNVFQKNKYSYIDEKFNNIEKDKSVIKFGVHYGQKWKHLADDYIIFIYSKIKKDGKYRQEIENE